MRPLMAFGIALALSSGLAGTPLLDTKAQFKLPAFSGSYKIGTKQTPISYSATRINFPVGSGGWVKIGTKSYWGVTTSTQSGINLTWYHGNDSTRPVAGRVNLTPTPQAKLTGPLTLTDPAGKIIDRGTAIFSAS
ncbi:MAG: hypothetical protein ACKO9Z_18450 [Planctomycetota bacterium]